MSDGLKLRAMETDDMTVISAACEGAITSSGEMSYSRVGRHFSLTYSRFMWEKYDEENPEATSYRIRSGLYFGDILGVKASGIHQDLPTMAMELLSVSCKAGEDGTAEIYLNFAGQGVLHLDAECIDVALTDVGEAWQAIAVPFHKGGTEAAAHPGPSQN